MFMMDSEYFFLKSFHCSVQGSFDVAELICHNFGFFILFGFD
jgi:hypothetical protein